MSVLHDRRLIHVVPLVLSLAMIFGCGSDSSSPPTVHPIEEATLALNSVTSIGRVGVQGLPAPTTKLELGDIEVVLQADGADDLRQLLDYDAEGWYFLAPLHPVDPLAGGDFRAHITDGEHQSEAQSLTVTGLPESPGAFASLVATITEHLEQRAGWAGTTIAELKATPREALADPTLLPLKLAQSYLDADSDPHDLTDLVDNSDSFLSEVQRELLDRVFGYFDLEAFLRLQIDALEAEESALLSLTPELAHKGLCINQRIRIDTAQELSMRMTQSAVAAFGADPESEAGSILANGATAFTALSVAPSIVGATASAAGAALGTVQAAVGFVAGLLPSSFVSIDFDIDRTEFNEDSTEFATYSNVVVVAASTGWSADQSIATVAINAFGSYLSFAGQAQILGSDFLRDLASAGLGTGAGEVFDDSGIIEFCPQQWTIDISDVLYNTAAALNHRFEVAGMRVYPREAGLDQLRVAAQSTQFGGREIHKDLAMQVKQIQVVVLPDDVTIDELGETVALTAEIHNADLTTLRWLPEWGNWEDGLGDDTNDGGTRPLRTPTTESAYPFQVRIESLSRRGPRESGEPPRIGYATIRYRDTRSLRIDPPYACISPGETQQFEAIVTGFEEYTVVWDVIEGYGSVNQNGLYTSLPIGTSNAVIEARVQEDEAVRGEARVDVSVCNCSFELTITGDANWEFQGSHIAYSVSQLEQLFYQFFVMTTDEGYPGASASIGGVDENPAPAPGQTGSWKAGFAFVTATQSWTSIWDDEKVPLPGVTVTITELTETEMVGRFSGNAFQLDEQGEVSSIIGVDMPFRAGNWSGGGWPCE